MATNNKKALKAERTEQVNSTQCCICFKLRSAVLLTVCVSLLLLIGYGYKYWTNPSIRDNEPVEWNGYAIMLGADLCVSVLGCIAVITHHRKFCKLFALCTCIMVTVFVVAVLFQVTPILHYLHFAFHLVWIVLQLVMLWLLWQYSQLLKVVYGWDDHEQGQWEEAASPSADDAEKAPERQPALSSPPASQSPASNKNGASVNVSINLTMPQQSAPVMYAQPPPQPYPVYQPYPYPHHHHMHPVSVDSTPKKAAVSANSNREVNEVQIVNLEQEGFDSDANGIPTTKVQAERDESSGDTPEPPAPPIQQNSDEALADDFIADVEPDQPPRRQTHDVNLYFLDS
eukprot:CAMPEP_0202688586 /NCGR_PEP_ID=MMETSP1385-20130828/4082_1 /ASSEMBLY_ACC=CAM_ASM_000861 /TAXON_ID=933848 /ORGANISM="Elphidium margaritaceum" /LENGTH=342 /DNA_ID=CAMNT_0049343595 /DNA_START=27 /DNA_END=1055 /DNA_ORIENTATION=-